MCVYIIFFVCVMCYLCKLYNIVSYRTLDLKVSTLSFLKTIMEKSMFIMILLDILIISNIIHATSMNIPTSHVRTIRVQTEYRDSHTDKHVYDVGLISTETKNGFEIVSEDEIIDDASGTTRIRCGTTLYESHDFMNNQEGRFFSLSSASDHPAVLLALLQCTRSGTCSNKDKFMYNFIILKQKLANAFHMSESTWDIQVENISNCELIFLNKEKQTIFPTRTIRDKKTRALISGISPLVLDNPVSCTKIIHSNETMMRSVVLPGIVRVVVSLSLSISLTHDINTPTQIRHLDNILHERASRGECVNISFSTNESSNTNKEEEHENVKFFNNQFLETSGKMKTSFSFIMDPLTKVLPIDMFTDVVGTLVATGIIGNDLEHSTAETASAVLEQELTNVLVSGLTNRVRKSLIDTLAESISESASESIALDMKRRVSSSLTASISTEMTRQIDRDVAEYVPSRVNAFAPQRLSRKLVSSLALVLTKSLSHTIVPSLIQTTGHSPLQDYYCYYCYHFQRYCQYCHYSPSQLYYAEYYTTYYSNYYASYYSDFYQRESDTDSASFKKSL